MDDNGFLWYVIFIVAFTLGILYLAYLLTGDHREYMSEIHQLCEQSGGVILTGYHNRFIACIDEDAVIEMPSR